MIQKFLYGGALFAALMIGSVNGAVAADIDPVFVNPVVKPVAPENNFYVSIFGGANFSAGDREFTNNTTIVDVDLDTGFQLGGAIGYKWRNVHLGPITPRTELEVSYFDNDVDTIDFSGNGVGNEVVLGNSDISGVNILANVYLDFDDLLGKGITPYVVGGLGVSIVDFDINYNAAVLNLRDTDEAFLWSVGAGANYDVTEEVSLFVDARFQQAVNVGSLRRVGGVPAVGAGGGNFDDDLSSIFVRGGLSYRF